MSIDPIGFRSEVPKNSPYEVKPLVVESLQVNQSTASDLQTSLNSSGIGSVRVSAVRDMSADKIAKLDRRVKRAINYSGSVIVDAGDGIGALVNATPRKEQEFSTLEVDRALIDAGIIPTGKKSLKMGASGAVTKENRGAEVIEVTVFNVRGNISRAGVLTKAAWSDERNHIHVDSFVDPSRVLLENEFVVSEGDTRESNALLFEIDTTRGDVDLYQQIAKLAREARIEHYTVRCTIKGPLKAKLAVIKHLPDQPLGDLDDVKGVLVAKDLETEDVFHFVGSRSDATSRRDKKWGKITGNEVYSPNGHYHGYSEDGKIGGHILALHPQPGSRVDLVLEPANVIQVVKKAS
jgi:hypothetical protein